MNENDVYQRIMAQMEAEKIAKEKEIEESFVFDDELKQFLQEYYKQLQGLQGTENIASDALTAIERGDAEEIERTRRIIKTRMNYLRPKADTEEEEEYLMRLRLLEKKLKDKLG